MAYHHKRVPSTDELIALAVEVYGFSVERGTQSAILGGLAMNLYGSPRLTKDVDFAASEILKPIPFGLKFVRPISFGGVVYGSRSEVDVDWIVRNDHYEMLYQEALTQAIPGPSGIPLVRLEHLAAIKMAASVKNSKHYDDLLFLLVHPDIDLRKTSNLVFKHVGGAFGVEQLEAAIEEARWKEEHSQ